VAARKSPALELEQAKGSVAFLPALFCFAIFVPDWSCRSFSAHRDWKPERPSPIGLARRLRTDQRRGSKKCGDIAYPYKNLRDHHPVGSYYDLGNTVVAIERALSSLRRRGLILLFRT
jgi:hypothetical protein